ncbi:MAG: hypothetical protein GY787_14755 [Alteromonadales bacterium]|nr:hypothetical protein [Alteromonadales bacterium]
MIKHIDVAIIAFNESNELALCNPAARKLLQITTTDNGTAFNYSGDQLTQVDEIPSGQSQVMTLTFCEQQGKYNVTKRPTEEMASNKRWFVSSVMKLITLYLLLLQLVRA